VIKSMMAQEEKAAAKICFVESSSDAIAENSHDSFSWLLFWNSGGIVIIYHCIITGDKWEGWWRRNGGATSGAVGWS
jgi:hypothetical protein